MSSLECYSLVLVMLKVEGLNPGIIIYFHCKNSNLINGLGLECDLWRSLTFGGSDTKLTGDCSGELRQLMDKPSKLKMKLCLAIVKVLYGQSFVGPVLQDCSAYKIAIIWRTRLPSYSYRMKLPSHWID